MEFQPHFVGSIWSEDSFGAEGLHTAIGAAGVHVAGRETAGKTGWVFDSALSSTKVNGEMNLMPGAAAEMSTGIAARGLQPGAESYVQSRNLTKAPLEQLIALRKNISPQEWTTFAAPVKRNP